MAREKDEPKYVLSDHFLMHFLEVPKLETDRFDNKLKKWLAFLKYEGKEAEKVKILLSDDDINKAHWEYEKFTQNDEMKELYEAHEKFLHDKASWIGNAKEKGIQENRQENAQRMIQDGLTIEKVAFYTGLSIEEVKELAMK